MVGGEAQARGIRIEDVEQRLTAVLALTAVIRNDPARLFVASDDAPLLELALAVKALRSDLTGLLEVMEAGNEALGG